VDKRLVNISDVLTDVKITPMIKTETSTPPSGVSQQQDWQVLFDMLPEIKRTKKFGRLVGSKKNA